MIFGAVAAIGQGNLKRLVAYSSIGHIGYALAGLSVGTNEGIQSSIVYISIYMVMNLGLFSCLFMMKRNDQYFETIDDLIWTVKKPSSFIFVFTRYTFFISRYSTVGRFFC